MKGDFTRQTFDGRNNYRSVLMQQGRVQLDADWNEQGEITLDRIETGTLDQIGASGGPIDGAGFLLAPAQSGGNLGIGRGRYYVDGILCRNGDEQIGVDPGIDASDQVLANAQPDLPADAPIVTLSSGTRVRLSQAQAGIYLAYLDVWTRHITALENPALREVALGGPDTATRSKTIWQVKLIRVSDLVENTDCLSLALPGSVTDAPTGTLNARAQPSTPTNDPCEVAPGGGYRRLENQLYRVEIHTGGTTGSASPPTFKWSRDNGSVVTQWLAKNDDDLTVAGTGRDSVLGFAAGNWVELTDETREQQGRPGTLVRLKKVEGDRLTIDPATATGTVDFADYSGAPKVRRWDSVWEAPGSSVVASGGWMPLEDGVEIRFSSGRYRSGDYWMVPARTATADVEWPRETTPQRNPIPQAPHGIEHHYALIAMVGFSGSEWSLIHDRRTLFPRLGEMTSLRYAGGDGQEAMPGFPLPQPLQVALFNGRWPVAGARIRFTAEQADHLSINAAGLMGSGTKSVDVVTDAEGIASCYWRPTADTTRPSQRVEARPLDPGCDPETAVVNFTGRLSIASQVAYDPGVTDCVPAEHTTVQTAIDYLCSKIGKSVCTFVIGPEDIVQGQLNPTLAAAIAEAVKTTGAKLCFRIGIYTLFEPIQLAGPGPITVSGCGFATRIICERSERVFLFDGCSNVVVESLHAEGRVARTGRVENDTLNRPRTNGVLTFIRCQDVTVDSVSLRCARAPGASRASACITVMGILPEANRQNEGSTKVRVRHCNLSIGRQQTGILLLDTARAHVEDNVLVNAPVERPVGTPPPRRDLLEAGQQGIVVAGRIAQDVRVLDNSITGVRQGIHIGVSHRQTREEARTGWDLAGVVNVSGNTVSVALSGASRRERHGIFLGNSNSVLVENNTVVVNRIEQGDNRSMRVEGIRIYGKIGKMMLVRQNQLYNCDVGIRITPTPIFNLTSSGARKRNYQWVAQFNMAPDAAYQIDERVLDIDNNS